LRYGLGELGSHTELLAAGHISMLPPRGQHDNGYTLKVWISPDFRHEGKAIHLWHLHIG
jgi:hypothetical protein